jgi:hypothetical protein
MMKYGKLMCLCLLVCCMCAGTFGYAATRQRLMLNGNVTVETRGQLPQHMVARLYFPKGINRSPLVTRVDERGSFSFEDLQAGRFMLELYDGDNLLHQQVLTLPDEQKIVVKLKTRQ